MSKHLAIQDVVPGMFIVAVTKQQGPVHIKKSGLVSSAAMVEALAQMGVVEVAIDPDMTVEISDTPATLSSSSPSATQRLLRNSKASSASHMFMDNPSVLSAPLMAVDTLSVWQRFRWPLRYLLVLVGGGAVGFSVATSSLWWPAIEVSQPSLTVSNDIVSVMPVDGTEQMVSEPLVPAPVEPEAENVTSNVAPPNEADIVTQDNPETPVEDNPVVVSPQLLAKFNQALADIEAERTQAEKPSTAPFTGMLPSKPATDIPRVDQLPARLLTRLPRMVFSAHMYASEPNERWVRVNGQQLGEGEWIDDQVQIINIEGPHVVLQFQGELFRMAALTDW